MKKAILFIVISFTLNFAGWAQVGVNTDGSAPNPSAILDAKSTTRGFLPPRMTTPQRNMISSPASGLMIYNTDCNDIHYYNGAIWIPLGSSGLLPTPGTITGNTISCFNSFGVQYSISAVPNATGYHWTVPPGATVASGQGSTSITVNFGGESGLVSVVAVNDCHKSAPQSIEVELITPPADPQLFITADMNPACSTALVTFTADWISSGGVMGFQWYVNGILVPGAFFQTYTYAPTNNDVVQCVMFTDEVCYGTYPTYSNQITMVVNPLQPVSISIVASTNTICYGTPVTFTATPSNGGTSPGFQWKKNGSNISGATNAIYTYAPANNDIITCALTPSINCPSANPVISNGVTMIVETSLAKSHVAGSVAPVSKSVTYGLVSNIPGETSKCWITRNLGASSQATTVSTSTEAAAGWYWQFNRKQGFKHDGTTVTPAWTITSINQNSDWTAANDPCTIELGGAWRIPTATEWTNVDNSGSWTNWNGPFNSALKLHAAGLINYSNGALNFRGTLGYYWSNNQVDNTIGKMFTFSSSGSNSGSSDKMNGFSVRCLK